MNKVYILVEGYAHSAGENSYIASPTTTLIETEDKKIIVDPGTNQQKLFIGLKDKHITTDAIDFIYLSHYHPDHFLNIRLFPQIPICDSTTLWDDEREKFHTGYIPETDIEILLTPGHSPEHSSLLVKTQDGIVCIAQDVFWWEDGKQKSDKEEDLLNLEDPFATDKGALLQSRKLILERADIIIPGHGKVFQNPTKK